MSGNSPLPQTLEDKINNLTDLQIRMLLSSIFAQRGEIKDTSELDENLVKMRDSWQRKDGDPFLSSTELVDKIKKTMKDTHDYFVQQGIAKDSLKENGVFASYMIASVVKDSIGTGQSEANQRLYRGIMYDFCNYSCQISLRAQEQQEICLESFPPEGEYLNCLDGTKKRIEDLYNNLTDSEQNRPFIHAHNVITRNIVELLKYNVFAGNETHIPHYLDYSFGLKKEKDICPQSQIPTAIGWSIHVGFPPYFKKELVKAMLSEEQERRNKSTIIVQNIVGGFPEVDLENFSVDEDVVAQRLGETIDSAAVQKAVAEASACIQAINSGLAAYEIGGQSFVKSDADGNAHFDQALLDQSVIATPALKFLNEFLAQEKVALLTAEKPNKPASLEALRKDDGFVMFSETTIRHIITLLTAIDGATPVNHDETLAGLELLWMMGDHLAGNCPVAFVGIMRELNKIEPDYLSKNVAPQIEKFLPDQVEKIQRIQERFEVLNVDQNIIPFLTPFDRPKIFFGAPLGNLLYGNAPQEVITRHIAGASSASTLISEMDSSLKALVLQPSTQSSSEISPYSWACRQLMLRPDSHGIFETLLQKMEKEVADAQRRNPTVSTNPPVLPNEFLKECLAVSAQNNQTESCQFLINKFGTTKAIFNGNPAIHQAALHNNTELMSYYINILTHVGELMRVTEVVDDKGNTVAALAAQLGSAEVIKTMHDSGIALDKLNQTRLRSENKLVHLAAHYGKANVVRMLGILGDDLNVVNAAGSTAAHCAAQDGHANVIEILAAAGITGEKLNAVNKDDFTPMELAIYANKKDSVVALCEAGVRDQLLNKKDVNGDAPINLVAAKGLADFVELLSGFGADLNQKNNYGDAPIHTAINKGHPEVVVALGKAKANLSAENKDGKTPLTLALEIKSVAAVKALKDGGLDFEIVNDRGNNLLHIAAGKDEEGVVRTLIDAGIDLTQLDKKNNKGNTPLMIALKKGFLGFMKALKDAGVNLDQEDEAGHTLLYQVFRDVDPRTMSDHNMLQAENLISAGAQINHKNKDGNAAIHLAVLEGNLSAFKMLKKLGADLKQTNKDGETAFDLALHQGKLDIIRQYDLEAPTKKDNSFTVLNDSIVKKDVVAVRNLINAGINLTTGDDATTYLNHAAYIGNIEIVDLLLSQKSKININMLDPADETALHYAALGKQIKMMQHLRDRGAKDVKNYEGDLPDDVLAAEMAKSADRVVPEAISVPPSLSEDKQEDEPSPSATAAFPLPSPPTEQTKVTSVENVLIKSKPSQHPHASNVVAVNDNVNPNLVDL